MTANFLFSHYVPVALTGLLLCSSIALAQTDDRASQTGLGFGGAPVVSERVVSGQQGVDSATQNADGAVYGADLLPEGEPEAPRSAVRTYQEDAGSRVEELRVAGETQEIIVTPAGRMPSYEVQPRNAHTFQIQDRRSADGTNGPRRWKIGEF